MTRGTSSPRPAAKRSTAFLCSVLGPRLKAARVAAGLTQADVAKAMEIATEVYGRLERGKILPSLPTFWRLCSALNVEASTLLQPKEGKVRATMRPAAATLALAHNLQDSREVRRILHRLPKASPEQLRAVYFVLGLLTKHRTKKGRVRS